jgi:hypothetical protein
MYTKLQGSLMADVRFGSRPDSSLSDGQHDAHRVRPHCGWQSAGGVVHHEFGDALVLATQADAGPGTAQQRCLIQRKSQNSVAVRGQDPVTVDTGTSLLDDGGRPRVAALFGQQK